MKHTSLIGLFISFAFCLTAQDVNITINATQNKKEISPYIYGKNNSGRGDAQYYKEAGLRIARLNQGNNSTKYNWRKKMSSHPDWYNNVYANNWDETSEYYAENCPDMQIMWAFQLLGRVASNTANNFNDWEYNNSQWWQGVHQNLAGGGTPNQANPTGDALAEGDVNLYTQEWPADSTVALLNHWFGDGGLGFNKNQFVYWSMDNEPDIWDGTHNDVMPNGLLLASDFMDKYIEVAKKARAVFPEIKICGPVTTNEWQWYKWGDESITIDGQYYCWLEYFIKRCAEEEQTSGIRVLDVLDIHSYPYAESAEDALQFHRTYFDQDYVFPGANGVKTINGGWDNSQNKEYILQRINNWLDAYFGVYHGIKTGISEWGPSTNTPDISSVAYASLLGTFANNDVEFLMPWNWGIGMWETLHLFSRYSQEYSVSSTSSQENTVSAYTSVNETSDSMTIIIVNRNMSSEQNIAVNVSGFSILDGAYKTLQLANLPVGETFISHTNNALKQSEISVYTNAFTLTVPPLSTTAIMVSTLGDVGVEEKLFKSNIEVYPNPVSDNLKVNIHSNVSEPMHIIIRDQAGRELMYKNKKYDGNSPLDLDISSLGMGVYFVSISNKSFNSTRKIVINK